MIEILRIFQIFDYQSINLLIKSIYIFVFIYINGNVD
jgi:hypothetical protein